MTNPDICAPPDRKVTISKQAQICSTNLPQRGHPQARVKGDGLNWHVEEDSVFIKLAFQPEKGASKVFLRINFNSKSRQFKEMRGSDPAYPPKLYLTQRRNGATAKMVQMPMVHGVKN